MTDRSDRAPLPGDTKYGDADVASKRRKSLDRSDVLGQDADAEYDTLFTKRLNDNCDMNSTLHSDHDPADQAGAPTSHPSLQLIPPVAGDWQPHDLVSPTPSASSRGFENTFKVLQHQVLDHQMRIAGPFPAAAHRRQLPVQAQLSHRTLQQNPIFLNVSYGRKERFLRAISEESSVRGGGDESDDEANEPPSFLELELDARQRIRELSAEQGARTTGNASDTAAGHDEPDALQLATRAEANTDASMTEFLYGIPIHGAPTPRFAPAGPEAEEEFVEQQEQQVGEYPEYVYHMARDKAGRKYLRVVRSMAAGKVLCGNRVSQMTRAYDDIEAVTRLLEEKEKDLELTVQIGKELLTQNTRLENRVAELESDVKTANENLAQLSYDLHTKSSLLAALTNDDDVSSEASTPNFPKSFNLDLLQKKIGNLEDENKSLRAEANQLVRETDAVEEQERKLMEDITAQLNTAHYQYDGINLELERYREENKLQHEQICHLTAQLTEAQIRLHQLTSENEEQTSRLSITEENQSLLAGELTEFKARYHEVLALLQETQEQLRQQRRRQQPTVRGNLMGGTAGAAFGGGLGVGGPCGPIDSLQSELMESSLFSDNSLDSGIASDRGGGGLHHLHPHLGGHLKPVAAPGYNKVFETVRCATKTGHYAESGGGSDAGSTVQLGGMSMSTSAQPRMSSYPFAGSSASSNRYASSVYSSSTYPSSMGAKTFSRESLLSDSDNDQTYPARPAAGVPGAPGAKDLEAALRRLTPAQVLARRSMLSNAPPGTYNYDEPGAGGSGGGLPMGIRTPDSIMSTGSSGMSAMSAGSAAASASLHGGGGGLGGGSGRFSFGSASTTSGGSQHHLQHSGNPSWRLPDKLQIVKPMEGSQTLHHWSRLATPTLGGLLDERPGVTIRGGRGLDELGMHIYSLSDVEEDECDDPAPAKQFASYGSVYTYTNSTVMHPDDGMSMTSSMPASQMSSRVESVCSSRQPSAPSTPRRGLSRRNSCSTFSVNLGLASMLNERGIKGVTPSAINTPAGPNFTPTVTPCNSPDGSPTRDRSPEPALFGGLFSCGADMLRRKLVGSSASGSGSSGANFSGLDRSNIGSSADRPSRMSARNQVLLSRQEKRALRSLRLLEKVESLGLDSMMPAVGAQRGLSPLAMQANAAAAAASVAVAAAAAAAASGTTATAGASPGFQGVRKRTASPMAQLTSLKPGHGHGAGLFGAACGSSDDEQLQHQQQLTTMRSALSVGESLASLGDSDHSASECAPTSTAASATTPAQRAGQHRPVRPTSVTIAANSSNTSATTAVTDRQTSPTDTRLKQMQRQKSRRALLNNGQRPDLGTVAGKVRPDLGRVAAPPKAGGGAAAAAAVQDIDAPMTTTAAQQQQSITQSFVGTISSLFFGRKGGLL